MQFFVLSLIAGSFAGDCALNVVKDLNVLWAYMERRLSDVDEIFTNCFNIHLTLTKRFLCDAGLPIAAAQLLPFRRLLTPPTHVDVDPRMWVCDDEPAD